MRGRLGILWAAALAAAACSGDDECARSSDARGRVVLDCPRIGPVTLEGEPPDGAICRAEGDRIACGGERYGLDGARLPGPDQDAGRIGEADAPPAPGAPIAAAPVSAPCQTAGESVICADGARATLSEADRSSLGPGPARCSSRLLPGAGRRVVCRAGDPGSAIALDPEPGTVDASELAITCERDGLKIECTDGSRYEEEEGGGGPLDADPGACADPRPAEADPRRVARCLAAVECAPGGCAPADLEPRDPACAAALDAPIVCGGGEELVGPPRCYAPESGLAIRTAADFGALSGLSCRAIYGDVAIAPERDARGAERGRVDLDWLRALGGVRAIYGSLTVDYGLVPDSDAEREEFARIADDLELRYVAGDLKFSRNSGVRALPEFGELRRIGGALNVEANPNLGALGVVRSGQRLGALSINGNPALALLTWFVPRLGPIEGIARPRIDGAFIFAANPRYDPCLLPSLTSWGLKQASEVLVSGGGGTRATNRITPSARDGSRPIGSIPACWSGPAYPTL